MRKILLSLLLSISLLCNMPISVHASDFGGGGISRDDLKNWDNWTFEEKYQYYAVGALDLVGAVVGCFMHGDSNALYLSYLRTVWDDLSVEDMSFEEWVAMRLGYDSETDEISVDNELVDLMHSACVMYIEENTGFYVFDTFRFDDLPADLFYSSVHYNNVKNFFNSLDNNNEVILYSVDKNSGTCYMQMKEIDSNAEYVLYDDNGYLVDKDSNGNYISMGINVYIDWVQYNPYYDFINLDTAELDADKSNSAKTNISNYYQHAMAYYYKSGYWSGLYSKDGHSVRIYKTLEELKNYSVGQRSYYITDTFKNYDSTVDNSTTITQTEIDNSVTYGDVYNYITNNYENPDCLSEDELRAILAEYLSQINNNNSGGGSGGSGDSGGSGGGLGGFLDGLGSVGNAILAILGKLMEILGSAIELVTGSITDLITIIPNSIGELLGALFPVFPEEWIKAITLSLVLGVIVGIVRIFK